MAKMRKTKEKKIRFGVKGQSETSDVKNRVVFGARVGFRVRVVFRVRVGFRVRVVFRARVRVVFRARVRVGLGLEVKVCATILNWAIPEITET